MGIVNLASGPPAHEHGITWLAPADFGADCVPSTWGAAGIFKLARPVFGRRNRIVFYGNTAVDYLQSLVGDADMEKKIGGFHKNYVSMGVIKSDAGVQGLPCL